MAKRSGSKKRSAKAVKKVEPKPTTTDEDEEMESEDEKPAKTNGESTKSKRDKVVKADEEEEKVEDEEDEDEPAPKKGAGKNKKVASKTIKKKGRGRPSTKKSTAVAKGKKTAKKEESESESEDPDADYEVETILEVRNHRDGSREFFVKWKGYPKSKATWEPEDHLVDCPEKLQAFEKKLDTLKEASEHELRTQPKQTKHYQDSKRNAGVRTSRRFAAKPRTTYEGMSDD